MSASRRPRSACSAHVAVEQAVDRARYYRSELSDRARIGVLRIGTEALVDQRRHRFVRAIRPCARPPAIRRTASRSRAAPGRLSTRRAKHLADEVLAQLLAHEVAGDLTRRRIRAAAGPRHVRDSAAGRRDRSDRTRRAWSSPRDSSRPRAARRRATRRARGHRRIPGTRWSGPEPARSPAHGVVTAPSVASRPFGCRRACGSISCSRRA